VLVNGPWTLVTGATGLIGRPLVASLLADGVAVRVLTRGGRALPTEWHGAVDVVRGDLTDPASLPPVVHGCTRLFHLAGELRDADRVRAVNTDGTRQLLEAAGRAGVRHVIHMSSVGIMGVEAAGVADEDAAGEPRTPYEISKRDAERLALGWSAASGVPLTALRPTIVFGARAGDGPDSFLALLRAVAAGRFMFPGRAGIANYVHVDDVVSACRTAAAGCARGVFIVADPCPLTVFVEAAATALGVPPPRRVIPVPVAYTLAACLEAAGALTGRRVPLTRARVQALANRTEFRSSRITRELGWSPPVGYAEGLKRTVAAYRQAGKLPA
jgi:nucleoside-diphosphate-sugar epimerase